MKRGLLFLSLFFIILSIGARELDDYQGINIETTESDLEQGLNINGSISMFVNCGSQYSVWNQFPQTILYVLKDLNTGDIYKSNDTELSISESGNSTYERYGKEPCNKIVTKEFSSSITSIYFNRPPKTEISNFELKASYMGFSSNALVIKNTSLILNSTISFFL